MLVKAPVDENNSFLVDNDMLSQGFSEGALALYMQYCYLGQESFSKSNEEVAQMMGISMPTFFRRKKELREAGILPIGL